LSSCRHRHFGHSTFTFASLFYIHFDIMPAYHSKIEASKSLGNTALLTFKTKTRGPVHQVLSTDLTEVAGE